MSQETHVQITDLASGYEQRIEARQHSWSADEPVGVGGTDVGPTPYELLLGALGSCIAITVRMYARRKEWPLNRISVELRHRKVHAKDCVDCEQSDGYVDLIDKQVTLEGSLSKEQRERLTEIAERCPVHKTLTQGSKIRTSR